MSLNPDPYFDIRATGVYRAMGTTSGGVANLAKALKVSRQVCYSWLQRGYVPVGRAVEIEQITGVPAAELIDPKLRKIAQG